MLSNTWDFLKTKALNLKDIYGNVKIFFTPNFPQVSVEVKDARSPLRFNLEGRNKICQYVNSSVCNRARISFDKKKIIINIGGKDFSYPLTPLEDQEIKQLNKNGKTIHPVIKHEGNIIYRVDFNSIDSGSKGYEAFGLTKLQAESRCLCLLIIDGKPVGSGEKIFRARSGNYEPFLFYVKDQETNKLGLLLTFMLLPLNLIGSIIPFILRFSANLLLNKPGNLFQYFSDKAINTQYEDSLAIKKREDVATITKRQWFKKRFLSVVGGFFGTTATFFFILEAAVRGITGIAESLIRSPTIFIDAFYNYNDNFQFKRGLEALKYPVTFLGNDISYRAKKFVILLTKCHVIFHPLFYKDIDDDLLNLNTKNKDNKFGDTNVAYGTYSQLNVLQNKIDNKEYLLDQCVNDHHPSGKEDKNTNTLSNATVENVNRQRSIVN